MDFGCQKNAEFGADFEFVEKVAKSLGQKRLNSFTFIFQYKIFILYTNNGFL
jgi:hypothetical protein